MERDDTMDQDRARGLRLDTVCIDNPDEMNFIFGQTHFIKSVEDIHEAVVNRIPSAKFGLAFSEASGPCLVRTSGTDDTLIERASANLEAIACGHTFIIFMKEIFPINILPAIKAVPEVCSIFCATANPTEVVVAETDRGRGVLGVIDGAPPEGVEDEDAKAKRHEFLRMIGYKL